MALQRSGIAGLILMGLVGCSMHPSVMDSPIVPVQTAEVELIAPATEYLDEMTVEPPMVEEGALIPRPLSIESQEAEQWPLRLDEVVQIALSNSDVLRDLGGRILQLPELKRTVYGPSIRATDPRFGIESALSVFDAEFSTRAFYEKNDRALNNALLGGGTNFFVQDLWRFQTELRKRAATGAEFSLRHNVTDDLNNAPANTFGTAPNVINAHAWTWNLEAEVRQPLLQGGGTQFNRIAGPTDTPGVTDGVVVARLNTKISVADFQLGLRNFISNVENAYWELHFAYRDLEAKKQARDRSLDTWRQLQELQKEGSKFAKADVVAQAAEQYFRFQQQVEDALCGRLVEGTRDFNGSTGGTFQGVGGVYVAERRLRLIMGLPINDGRLIVPQTSPPESKIIFDWNEMVTQSLARRVELQRQSLRVRRREFELSAQRNFLLPRFDLVARYRRNGLGDGLYDARVPDPTGLSVDSGNDEWQVGAEFGYTLGYRRANSSVRNAELNLSRDRVILKELERQIIHDISNALADQERAFQVSQTARNRRISAEKQLQAQMSEEVRETRRESDFNLILDAQRRAAEAAIAYHHAVTAYAVALKNLNLEMGTFFDYCNIQMADNMMDAGQG